MKLFLNLIPSSHINTLGWTLLHSLWQGALLGLLAALGFYLLRHRPAATRYGAGVGLLIAQLLASVATYLYYLPSSAAAVATVPYVAATPVATLTSDGLSQPLPLLYQMQLWLTAHLSELVVCWFIGVGLLLLRFVGGWVYLERLRYTSRLVSDRTWNTRFGVLVARLDVSQSVEFRETARIVTPMVVGVLRPVVLVPLGLMAGLSPAEAEAILAHELAHIRRYDYLVNLMQSLVEVIYFFHPALWWLSNRIRAEREHCCDDLAMAVCGDRVSLAHALVRVAEFRQESSLVVAFAADKPLLLQRIRRVLGVNEKPRRPVFGYAPSAALLLSLLVGASVYAYQKDDQKTQKTTKRQDRKVETRVSPHITGQLVLDTIIEAEVAMPVEVEREIEEEIAIAMEVPKIMNDTLREKMAEYHEKMRVLQQQMRPHQEEIQALHKQMEPLHRKMADMQLDMEKQRFEVERVQREQEKIEWKKQQAMQARQELVQKRSAVMSPKAGQNKLSEAELEKQLATFESQIKTKEQEITALNEQIAQSRKQMNEVEKPMNNLEAEMEKVSREMEVYDQKMEVISEKMEIIGEKIEKEAREMESYMPRPPASPRSPKAVAPPKGKLSPASPAAPRPPKATLAPAVKGKVTTTTPAPPAAPIPPKKK